MAQAQAQQPVQAEIQKPVVGKEQPVEGKKMQWWIWLIIALVVVGIGVGLYYWLM